jgi:hypothetical protein
VGVDKWIFHAGMKFLAGWLRLLGGKQDALPPKTAATLLEPEQGVKDEILEIACFKNTPGLGINSPSRGVLCVGFSQTVRSETRQIDAKPYLTAGYSGRPLARQRDHPGQIFSHTTLALEILPTRYRTL